MQVDTLTTVSDWQEQVALENKDYVFLTTDAGMEVRTIKGFRLWFFTWEALSSPLFREKVERMLSLWRRFYAHTDDVVRMYGLMAMFSVRDEIVQDNHGRYFSIFWSREEQRICKVRMKAGDGGEWLRDAMECLCSTYAPPRNNGQDPAQLEL